MDLQAWFEPRRAGVDTALGRLFEDADPSAFTEPLRYALLGGEKRIRPAICLAAFEAIAAPDVDRSRSVASGNIRRIDSQLFPGT